MPIQAILFNPPICVARVGESTVPMDAFSWFAGGDPHVIGETQIKPEWTLDVQSDGSVAPRMPDRFTLKDEGKIRPVAPFIEVWCDVGDDGDETNWTRRPLTTSLLRENNLNIANITFTVIAMNRKVTRRTGVASHRYGTFQPVSVRGDEHTPQTLRGTSPPPGPGETPLIPVDRFIPMGSVQVIRPGTQPAETDNVLWARDVNVETVRIRVTPPRGEFYGPPGSEQAVEPFSRSGGFSAVPPGNNFLNANAGWLGARTERVSVAPGARPRGLVAPGDTYDGAELSGESDPSLGIIDDICELLVRVVLDQGPIGRPALRGRANVFCGPPDYAPDRRPFVSLADDLNDRLGDKNSRNAAISDQDPGSLGRGPVRARLQVGLAHERRHLETGTRG